MPLREFLQMFGENLESSQPNAPSPTGTASGPERELVELVYDNGQFRMQGQAQGPSNRAKKSPQMNDYQWQPHRVHDRQTGPSVPSGHVYLTQDEIDPWLNYAEDDDGFRQDFCAEISAEISGVTGNDPPGHNNFLSLGNDSLNQMLQHSNLVPVHHDVSLEVRNATKVASKNDFGNSCLPVQGHVSVPPVGRGPPNRDASTTSNRPNVSCGNAVGGQTSANDFESMKTQKQNSGMPGSGTSILNFSYFSRPAANYRAGLEKVDCSTASCSFSVEKTGNDKLSAASDSTPMKSSHMIPCSNRSKGIYSHAQPKLVSANFNSKESVKQPEESCCAEQSYAHRQDDVIKSPGQGTRQVTDYENNIEHVVAASSVSSGNSGERASNDQIPNSKRKSRDVDEAESPSEDNEEESVGAKKRSHARGCSSSKRSRAAEVHNLSERRRRDRINEKMRALQELIPNCNKADKASMLDEAIEYLKTLQLQVQMMSMGAGLCMPPMMYPHGLQHMHPAHMPHFSALPGGMGMGMGMGYGMGMIGMVSGSPRYPIYPVLPMQGGHFRSPAPGSAAFRGMAGPNLQVYGHPGQGMPMPVPRAPSVPPMGQAPISSAVGLNDSTMRVSAEAPNATPVINSGFTPQSENSHLARNTGTGTSLNQTANQLQATNKDFEQPVVASTADQAPIIGAATTANLTTTKDVSRKGGDLTVSGE